ncbi:DUF4153 domain-containing protein [Pararoseomonas sp. SCSIO 73927]|uniref:DUF4153 domain-containing protein n=1 Tax=Pararoseomonas sp. SCSIO 73927 TaxID=3114537 RepID=UPI0030CE1FEA
MTTRPTETPLAWLGALRLGIGLGQGVALYALGTLVRGAGVHPLVTAHPRAYGVAVLLAGLAPFPLLLGLGHFRPRVLAGWVLAAALLILGLGWHDLGQNARPDLPLPSPRLVVALSAILFIGHALLAAREADRARGGRGLPRYADLFEASWRGALQLAQAVAFVGSFWIVFWVGDQMFRAIGIGALNSLARRHAFVLPVSFGLGALAVHAADAREDMARGLRRLALGLEAWLTPLLAVLVAAFLLALPVTGLGPLLARSYAIPSLLFAAAMLVLLTNAVHQDGREAPPRLLDLSARLAGILLVPLTALAAWGLALRVLEYGWTEARVAGAAALVLLALYALGYAAAALRPGMRLLEPVNVLAAGVAILVLAALNTPLADPVRLSVASQTGRLLRGEVPPERFDFAWLARAGRDGRQAREALLTNPNPVIAERAGNRARPRRSWEAPVARGPVRLEAAPAGAALPAGLLAAVEAELQGAAAEASRPQCTEPGCVARALPLEGREAWLVGPVHGDFWAMVPKGEGWRRLAIYRAPFHCRERARGGIAETGPRPLPPRLPELEANGVRLEPVLPRRDCG